MSIESFSVELRAVYKKEEKMVVDVELVDYRQATLSEELSLLQELDSKMEGDMRIFLGFFVLVIMGCGGAMVVSVKDTYGMLPLLTLLGLVAFSFCGFFEAVNFYRKGVCAARSLKNKDFLFRSRLASGDLFQIKHSDLRRKHAFKRWFQRSVSRRQNHYRAVLNIMWMGSWWIFTVVLYVLTMTVLAT